PLGETGHKVIITAGSTIKGEVVDNEPTIFSGSLGLEFVHKTMGPLLAGRIEDCVFDAKNGEVSFHGELELLCELEAVLGETGYSLVVMPHVTMLTCD